MVHAFLSCGKLAAVVQTAAARPITQANVLMFFVSSDVSNQPEAARAHSGGQTFVQVLRLGGLTGREDHIPVALHVDDSPASRICFIECLVETAHIGFAIISPFAVRIGVMHKAHEA